MLLTTAQMHEDAIDAYYERFATGDDLFVYPCMRLRGHVAYYEVIEERYKDDDTRESCLVYVDPYLPEIVGCNCRDGVGGVKPCAHMGAVFLHRIAQNYSDL